MKIGYTTNTLVTVHLPAWKLLGIAACCKASCQLAGNVYLATFWPEMDVVELVC